MENLNKHEVSLMAESNAGPVTAIARPAARLAVAGALLFLMLLAALHFIKPEFDPSWRMISEYEIGDYGWVMTLAFLSLSFSHVSLFLSLRSQVVTISGRLGLALLLLGGVGAAMGGIFTSDPITAAKDQLTMHGNLHGVGFLLGVPAFPLAATLISRALSRRQAWAPARRVLFWAATLPWVGLAVMILSMVIMLPRGHGIFTPEVLIGWPNRFLILTYTAWLITAGSCATRFRE